MSGFLDHESQKKYCSNLLFKTIHFLLFLLLPLTPASSILRDSVLMGSSCSSDRGCYSKLLYCSDTGVCTCNQTLSNLLFKHESSSRDIDAWCEVVPCSLNKTLDIDECLLQNAECVPNLLVGSENFCKCPMGTVGASVERYPIAIDFKCINFQLSTIDEPCWTDRLDKKIMKLSKNYSYPVCDRHKRLECNSNNLCTCHKDCKFGFSENKCVKKVGRYTNLCDSTEECNGEMVCENQRCNCPPRCERQYVIEDNICSCLDPRSLIGKILLSVLAVSGVFFIALGYAYYRENKKRTSALIIPEEFSLQAGILHPSAPNNEQIQLDPHAASAPVLYPASALVLYPEYALPTYCSQISDGLPTYNEAIQTNLKMSEAIKEPK